MGAVSPDGRLAAYSPSATDVRAAGTVGLSDGTTLRGTSAAAPAVAGVVAEMTAAAGEDGLTPAETERLLRETAVNGRIDRGSAVAAAMEGNRTGEDTTAGAGRGRIAARDPRSTIPRVPKRLGRHPDVSNSCENPAAPRSPSASRSTGSGPPSRCSCWCRSTS
ncbi:S8 family serine peptidase [Halobaculum halobium]|uniref:S8 family serine peptidase n=1 Tax=Halobaculum halobium TaxID=3032281 RepID=UPI0036179BA3